jgi:SMC interacting uncharacterized protein involved in chromosome segregation
MKDLDKMIKEIELSEKEMVRIEAKEDALLTQLEEYGIDNIQDAESYIRKEESKNEKAKERLEIEKQEIMNEWV